MSLELVIAILTAVFLAFSNGANDNFKGVATLYGSGTVNYKLALFWASITTFLGSILALIFASELISNFSGKGLVPDSIVAVQSFTVSVAFAAALTVFIATRLGFPISTTHALTGALVGAGFLASSGQVNYSKLLNSFFIPLLLSPILAVFAAALFYLSMSAIRKKLGISKNSCLCIGNQVIAPAFNPSTELGALHSVNLLPAQLQIQGQPTLSFDTQVSCKNKYIGGFIGINSNTLLDVSHFITSGLVSFARGLNDTPKIAAILIATAGLNSTISLVLVGVIMLTGGIIMSTRVAQKMSKEITEMSESQGFAANLMTSLIVIGASRFGLPVSTTHVSCGALFGIGSATGKAHFSVIAKIILSWVITLPASAFFAGLIFYLIQ